MRMQQQWLQSPETEIQEAAGSLKVLLVLEVVS